MSLITESVTPVILKSLKALLLIGWLGLSPFSSAPISQAHAADNFLAAKAKVPVSINDVCKKIKSSGPNGFLWKPKSEDSGPPREGRPTALWSKDIPTKSCLSLYAKNGVKIGQIGVYEYSGKYGGRWYSGYGCGDKKSASQLAKAAKQAAGRKKIYIEGRGGNCHGPFHPESREGSISY